MPAENLNPFPKNYQWPADKFTATEMAIQHCLREETGGPINHLLRDAILKLNAAVSNGIEAFNTMGEQNAEQKS